MNTAPGFIWANWSAPKSPALPGRPSTWMLTTSASANSASSEPTRLALPWANRSAVS
jgi:hypothetical protein